MQGIDLIILLFTASLVVKGVLKGFVKEIAGIVAVVLAVIFSFLYHKEAAAYLDNFIGPEYVVAVSYVAVFLIVYLLVMLLGNILDKVLKSVFLGGVNRILGGVFGAIKAVLWLTLATYAYSTLQSGIGFEHPEWLIDSAFYPFLLDITEILSQFLA